MGRLNEMKINTYTGYTTTKRYRVLIQPVEPDERTVFHYYTELKDLRAVIDSYIDDLSEEEDFQIFVKLNQLSEDGTSAIDVRITVTFEGTKSMFYPPEPVYINTKYGQYMVEATEEFESSILFSAILNLEEYPKKILHVLDSLIDKNGVTTTLMPIYILLTVHDKQLDLFEAFPLSITIIFNPNQKTVYEKWSPRKRMLQFKNFVSAPLEQGKNKNEKISKKR